MLEYSLASESGDEFLEAVGKMLGDGWIPQGGISLVIHDDRAIYTQAFIREYEDE